MPRIPHQTKIDNLYEAPMHADVQRELAGQDELHVIAARLDLKGEARAFDQQERKEPELTNAANPSWTCPLP